MCSVPSPVPGSQALAVSVPHSVAAEQALLGAIMVNNKLYDDLQGSLLAEHFYVPLHAAIFEGLETLINKGRDANPITLRERMRNTPFDADNALFPHLTAMFENAGLASDVKSLAEVIRTAYLQRQLMGLGDSLRLQAGTAHKPEDTEAVIDAASGELFRLAETGRASSTVRGMRHSLRDVIERAELAKKDGGGITGVAAGFADLDGLLGGLQRSDLIILGARPSMGKTSLIINIAQNAATRLLRGEANGAAVGVFSLEMSAEQLTQRMLCSAANISTQQISSGHLSDSDFGRMVAAAGEMADLPLYIDDTPGLSISAMRARARRMKQVYGIGLLIVDYLQLMTAPGKATDGNRVQEISAISQGLKLIARDLNIPVIAASQLSRSVESRDNKRPQLADLRESGSIEQDADLVMFLYREDYYLSRQLGAGDEPGNAKMMEMKDRLEKLRGVTELIVSKNRKGPTDTVRLLFHPQTTTFHNYAPAHRSQHLAA